MAESGIGEARGILNPREGEKRFRLSRRPPSRELGPFVECYWAVEWDLAGRGPHVQETLPHPSVQLVFEKGASAVFGVMRERFSRRLEGKGHAFGVKFRPGGFYPLWGRPVSGMTDRTVDVREALGEEGGALEGKMLATRDQDEMARLAEAFLRERLPRPDRNVVLLARIFDEMCSHPEMTTVEDLAARLEMNKRALQRLFSRYVGVGPKWVIRRYRLHEAAERLAGGEATNWAETALELGYFDQAHFVKDFKAMVGVPPAAYARLVSSTSSGTNTS